MSLDHITLARTLSERIEEKPGPGKEKAYCDALIEQMRRDQLFSVSVAPDLGGPGLSVADIARITFEIARQSGSAGLIYAMHMSQAYTLTTHGKTLHLQELQKRLHDEQLLIASGTSEKGPGGDILTSLCAIEEGDSGQMKVNKESPNISYVDHAGLILVTANRINANGKKRQVLIAASVNKDNFTSTFAAGFLGMRGIHNSGYKFQINFDEGAIFEDAFSGIARQSMTPSIQIFWASLWSGLAWHMIDKAKRFTTEAIPPDSDMAPVILHEMTRIVDLHHSMNTMIRDAIAAFENSADAKGMGFALSAQINRIKVNCSELLNQISIRTLSVIGIRGYAMGGPYTIAEPLADALSAPIMVSNVRLTLNTAQIERFVDERL
ncbi:acyl-CoA/acyl-ACP dehydrogenase [Octadecabacter sp. CECT 8868]|uniref:acyl-CoA dehydrogenase family protein n=1 Tax=Octadecabacter algicola TaxID=2909342 RepID=UPI001F2576D7|nr:acyl-CoA dehydrogenase family protein [Octadecabacter algicola]MCF2906694.1 acyl-CoA/acyl-ACP dehydrogenase [Octadecabacter algicola]